MWFIDVAGHLSLALRDRLLKRTGKCSKSRDEAREASLPGAALTPHVLTCSAKGHIHAGWCTPT